MPKTSGCTQRNSDVLPNKLNPKFPLIILFGQTFKARKDLRTSISASFILVGWLFGFYGISTTMGYLMPNPVHIY